MAMIQNAEEGKPPSPDDLSDIESSTCLNCHKPFNESEPIMFTRLGNDSLLWWHMARCSAKTK